MMTPKEWLHILRISSFGLGVCLLSSLLHHDTGNLLFERSYLGHTSGIIVSGLRYSCLRAELYSITFFRCARYVRTIIIRIITMTRRGAWSFPLIFYSIVFCTGACLGRTLMPISTIARSTRTRLQCSLRKRCTYLPLYVYTHLYAMTSKSVR